MFISGGPKSCKYSCIGLGTCKSVCKFDAIDIIDGKVIIDDEKCTGCGACVEVCPKELIELRPENKLVTIDCSSHDFGKDVKSVCDIGCIGCRLCVKSCPVEAITFEDFLPKIDYDKCINCGKCVTACPTKCITKREKKKIMAIENKIEHRGKIVKKVSENKVLVEILMEESSCKECKDKGACGIKVFKTEYPNMEMFCDIAVNEGDEILFSQKANYSFLASFLIFVLPLIMMITGYYVAGMIFGKSEAYGIAGSFIFLFISFIITYFVSKRLSKKSTQNMCVIKKI